MADKAEAKKVKNRCNGHLGHLATQLERWKGAIQLAKSTKLEHCIDQMRKIQVKCQEILDTCASLTIEALVLDPDDENPKTNLEKWQKDFDEISKDYAAAEAEVAQPVRPPIEETTSGGGARSRAIKPKPNDPLKP